VERSRPRKACERPEDDLNEHDRNNSPRGVILPLELRAWSGFRLVSVAHQKYKRKNAADDRQAHHGISHAFGDNLSALFVVKHHCIGSSTESTAKQTFGDPSPDWVTRLIAYQRVVKSVGVTTLFRVTTERRLHSYQRISFSLRNVMERQETARPSYTGVIQQNPFDAGRKHGNQQRLARVSPADSTT